MEAIAAIAPPLAALQLMKLQRDTTTLLSYADTAPPLESGLKQFSNEIPVMVTEELTMRKAAPVLTKLPLQLKNVEGRKKLGNTSKQTASISSNCHTQCSCACQLLPSAASHRCCHLLALPQSPQSSSTPETARTPAIAGRLHCHARPSLSLFKTSAPRASA